MVESLITRLAVIAVCGVAAFALRHQSMLLPQPYWHAITAAMALFAVSELLLPPRPATPPVRQALALAWRLGLIALALSAAGYAMKISDVYSRLWSGYWLAGTWAALTALSLVTTPRTTRHKHLVLVGEPDATARVRAHYLCPQPAPPLCLRPSQLLDWLAEQESAGALLHDHEILMVGQVPDPATRTALVLALHGKPVALRYCADYRDLMAGGESFTQPLLPPPATHDDMLKRAEDIVLGALALIAAAPLMAVIAVLVWRSGPGPLLFTQRRLGLGGRAFIIYKFRTMVPTAAAQAEAPQAENNDQRVTAIGRVLRQWGLDELPQLFNVLRGDMSLVGPRPHAFPHDMTWGAQLPDYAQRFRMRPGITGLAQVSGLRGHIDAIEDVSARLALDLKYIRTWSLGLDLRILFATLPALFRQGAPPPGKKPSPHVR